MVLYIHIYVYVQGIQELAYVYWVYKGLFYRYTRVYMYKVYKDLCSRYTRVGICVLGIHWVYVLGIQGYM